MPADQSMPVAKRARLQVHTVDPVLTRLLGALLLEWGFGLVAAGETAELHIVQEGCAGPAEGGKNIWLTSALYPASNRVVLPLAMEALWRGVEARLHAQPRRHLRLATRLPAELQAGSERVAVLVATLSDHGARLGAQRELARDDEVLLHLDCNGQLLAVDGRVIYCMPMGDLNGAAGYEIGLVFMAPEVRLRQTLRDFITTSYLQRVRAILSPAEFIAALPLLNISAGVLAHLESPCPQPLPRS